MQGQTVLHSSLSDEWVTPQSLFDLLDAEFHFTVDRAATFENKRCPLWYGPGSPLLEDALVGDWGGVGFLNPPYSQVGTFLEKAWYQNAVRDVVTVCLIAARPDTRYWWDYVTSASEIRFLKGRVKFSNAPSSAPFPSAVVIYRASDPFHVTPSVKTSWWDWRSQLTFGRPQPEIQHGV